MPTSSDILNDVDLNYRNTFTVDEKLVWFNEEQQELFDILELDSPPYAFTTVEGQNFYPFPDQFDVTKIKVVTFQTNTDKGFIEIPTKRNDDNQYTPYGCPWYSVVSDSFFLHVDNSVPDDRIVYIYCDSDPTQVTTANLSSSPDLPTKYQEILKLGILKRIAMARKDLVMMATYDDAYQSKISDVLLDKKLKEPEWPTAIDVLPRAGLRRSRAYGMVNMTVIGSE